MKQNEDQLFFYESDPGTDYYAVIQARSQKEAVRIYKRDVCSEPEEVQLRRVSLDHVLSIYDGAEQDVAEVADEGPMVLLVDAGLL